MSKLEFYKEYLNNLNNLINNPFVVRSFSNPKFILNIDISNRPVIDIYFIYEQDKVFNDSSEKVKHNIIIKKYITKDINIEELELQVLAEVYRWAHLGISVNGLTTEDGINIKAYSFRDLCKNGLTIQQ